MLRLTQTLELSLFFLPLSFSYDQRLRRAALSRSVYRKDGSNCQRTPTLTVSLLIYESGVALGPRLCFVFQAALLRCRR
ncbi:hypothetical protein R3P38DRAFT_2875408, partial [Favolaschia claudopus]